MNGKVALLAVLVVAGCGKKGEDRPEPAEKPASPTPPTTRGEPEPEAAVPDDVTAAMPRPAGAVIMQHLQRDTVGVGWAQAYCVGGDPDQAADELEKLHTGAGWKLARNPEPGQHSWRFNGEKANLRLLLRTTTAKDTGCPADTPIAVTAHARRRGGAGR